MEEFKTDKLKYEIEDIEELKKLPNDFLHEKVILGFDIYKYSQYPLDEQIYIPVLFKTLYASTVDNILVYEKFVFHTYGVKLKDFKDKFISTGDGGFQIFDNPLQAIVFSLIFQLNLKRFVSGSNTVLFRKNLHKIIDSIELRYAITSGLIYAYDKNFFGPGIINNARILSKDTLNRLLIDNNTLKWFTNNLNSVENLIDLDKESFLLTDYFKDYDSSMKSLLFDKKGSFLSVDVLKIGNITAKNTSLNIYNLHLQALVSLTIEKHEYNKFVITLGNLNTSGIE